MYKYLLYTIKMDKIPTQVYNGTKSTLSGTTCLVPRRPHYLMEAPNNYLLMGPEGATLPVKGHITRVSEHLSV